MYELGRVSVGADVELSYNGGKPELVAGRPALKIIILIDEFYS